MCLAPSFAIAVTPVERREQRWIGHDDLRVQLGGAGARATELAAAVRAPAMHLAVGERARVHLAGDTAVVFGERAEHDLDERADALMVRFAW